MSVLFLTPEGTVDRLKLRLPTIPVEPLPLKE
jgi:hypothetical protein